MENMLKRMLEVEEQGTAMIKEAEAKAQAMRDDNIRHIAAQKAVFDANLKQQYDALIADEVARQEKESKLVNEQQLIDEAAKCESFKRQIAQFEDKIFQMVAYAE